MSDAETRTAVDRAFPHGRHLANEGVGSDRTNRGDERREERSLGHRGANDEGERCLVERDVGAWVALRQTGITGGSAVSTTDVEQQARLDLRPFAVMRGDERTKEPEGLVLSRARLKATILASRLRAG
jgi:hypothetical protein